MSIAVYVPFVLSLLTAGLAPRATAWLEPRTATWLLTTAAVLLTGACLAALGALAVTAVGQVPFVANRGHWSEQMLRHEDPIWLPLAVVASILLCAAVAAGFHGTVRRIRVLAEAARATRGLPGQGRLVIVDDLTPDARAVPGRPGRVVVSSGMLDALDDREQRVLLAHEDAHLTAGHYLFLTAAQVAAAANPLMRSVAAAVKYTVERWADENAARQVGDRRLVACTIGKAALLTRNARPAILPVASGGTRAIGPVPRRVAALLSPPPRMRPLLLVIAVALLAITAANTLEAARDLHVLFELAGTTRR